MKANSTICFSHTTANAAVCVCVCVKVEILLCIRMTLGRNYSEAGNALALCPF